MPKIEFSTVELSTGQTATIYEGYGVHFFNALAKTKGDTSIICKYLIIELVEIEGKKLDETNIDSLHMKDVTHLSQIIGLMLSPEYKQGI